MTIEEKKINRKKNNKKKNKNKKSNRVVCIQSLGKIVPKQISWRLVAVFSKVCLEYDLFEFSNFTFKKVLNGVSFKVIPD